MKYKKANDLIENLLLYEFRECSGADPENSERGGPVPHPTLPPPPPPLNEHLGHTAYSIVGVFVMQSKKTFTFRKIKLKSIL